MPVVYEPPIAMTADELASVVLYLQSIGGEPDPAAITIPAEVRAHRLRRELAAPWEPYLDGDSARGHALFFDPTGPAACVTCHQVGDEGGAVGPELTGVAGTRTAAFIVESLLEPSASIANGYETVLIELATGRLVDGVVRRETADSLWLATSTGEESAFATAEIQRRRTQETSLMPEDLAGLLTVTELHDLLAYLRTLR
jgi:putative heme-binding domain-containing protein